MYQQAHNREEENFNWFQFTKQRLKENEKSVTLLEWQEKDVGIYKQ